MFKFLSMQKYEKSTVGSSRKSKEIYALRHITADNHAETKNKKYRCFHQGANLIEFGLVYQMFFKNEKCWLNLINRSFFN